MNLTVAELSDETRKKLKGIFPDWMPVANPVDLWPAMENMPPPMWISTAQR